MKASARGRRGGVYRYRIGPGINRDRNCTDPLVGAWVASIGLDPAAFGAHSLRCTRAVLIYRRTVGGQLMLSPAIFADCSIRRQACRYRLVSRHLPVYCSTTPQRV